MIVGDSEMEYCETFKAEVARIARANDIPESTVYAAWQQYCADCRCYDQSPGVGEFKRWNNWK